LDPNHLIREFQQIALIQKKLDGVINSDISKDEQIAQIIAHIESTNNFSTKTVENILSNKIVLTENSLNIIHHELKTPLVPIRAYTDMLFQGKFGHLTQEQKDKIEIISTNAKRLQQKIEVLLDKRMHGSINNVDDDKAKSSIKEMEQQNMLLEKINQLLVEKSDRDNSEIQKLQNKAVESERQKNEILQERLILNKTVHFEEQKNFQLGRKNIIIIATFALIVAVSFTSYSLYVVDLVGKQYQVSNLGKINSGGYLIQNLRGDTIDTWLSWRLVSGSTLHVGITNAAKYPDKIPLIKEVVLSEDSVDIDDSLLHKGLRGSISTYYVGWKGALEHISAQSTKFTIPSNIDVIDAQAGEGDITIILTNERNGDGYSGFTKSIADDSQNQILKSTITIYEVDKLNDEQFKTVLRHEFGHALGLAHSTAPEDLMAPTIQTGYPYISDCDVDTLVKLYDGGMNSQVTCEK
jgi:hypothetical protein